MDKPREEDQSDDGFGNEFGSEGPERTGAEGTNGSEDADQGGREGQVTVQDPRAIKLAAQGSTEDGAPGSSNGRAAQGTATCLGILQAPDIPLAPHCIKCKRPVDVLRAQLQNKGAGLWRCASCNTKAVQLTRIFGRWPPRSFQSLPSDFQEKFWRELDGKSGGAALEQHVIDTLTIKRIEEEQCSTGGEYLPLSVWKQRGFDPEAIQRQCRDTEMHPVLGLTYRVNIKAVYSKAIERIIREELHQGKRKPVSAISDKEQDEAQQDSAGGKNGTKDKKEAQQDSAGGKGGREDKKDKGDKKSKKRRRSSTSSSSTSSSSSSSAKSKRKGKKSSGSERKENNKKDKKNKKDDKAAAAADKLAKERAVAAKAQLKLAQRTIAKLSPTLVMLKQLITDEHVKNVPAFAKDPAKRSIATLQDFVQKSEASVKQQGRFELGWDISALEAESKSATERSALLSKMLETARKHA